MNFMTKYYRKYKSRLSFVCICVAGFLLLNSCEKDATTIGRGILPDSDHITIISTDTFRITSHTNYTTEVNTSGLLMPHIGSYSDPYFGTTTSGYVTQLRLEERFSDLDKYWEMEEDGSWNIDSVKLYLRVVSNYGSNNNFKYLRISEISDMLHNDTTYHFNTPVNTTGFGVSAIIPELRRDTINNISINLPIAFGEYMIRDTSKLFYTTDTNQEDFRNYFKGIYITIPTASASDPFSIGLDFNYFANSSQDLYDYQNYIVLYLRNNEGERDTYRFLLDSRRENARFTKIEHDFRSALPGWGIEKIVNTQIIDSMSYAQGLYGAFTTVSIAGLEGIKNDPNRLRTSINKAQLIVPTYLDNVTYADSTVAPRLLMRYVNEEGEKEMVPDYYVDDANEYFNGRLDAENQVYRFNISGFVQKYFDDTENKLKPELEIFVPSNNLPNTILKANHSKTPPKFELTLTNY